MKQLLIIAILSLGLLSACSGSSEKGTHRHADGRQHADHEDSTTSTVESTAAVRADTTAADTSAHAHSHERTHRHADGSVHADHSDSKKSADTTGHGHSHDQ